MAVIRYTQWDGSQRIRLDADKVLEKLSEYLSYTDDVRQAIDWLTRQGFDIDGSRVMGLDEFLEELRQEIRQRYRDFNLKNAMSEMEQRLQDILDRERDALESQRQQGKPGMQDKMQRLGNLPQRLSQALRKLENYEFEDGEAGEDFEELLSEYENIRDLENFRDRYGQMFHGPTSLNYEQALDLMREMERLKQLEQDLMSENFESISLEELKELLGQQAMQDFQNLRQVILLLKNSGYVMQKGNQLQLSPKGVRRIGELALRDIYQSLLKDRHGGHVTDYRGQVEMKPEQTHTWNFGEPLNLDLVGTLKRALARGPSVPLKLAAEGSKACDRKAGVPESR